jgi:glycosyltransferase involved in cell wall biosynthesis
MTASPRVTIGIATYNRDTYLAAAIDSCLDQDYESLEVLLVVDGSTNPRIDTVIGGYTDEARLRVVRHEDNRGIAAAYNTFVSAGRGELIAMLGDDDLSLPGRIRRQVELFDRYPDTGVVHGDGTIIDARGRQVGLWPSRDFSPAQLIHSFYFSHNHIVDPTRMVHRRVYEAVGGYDDRYPLANDLDFWLRAARRFRFRHCAGDPLTAIRRHGENTSDETVGRAAEIADVEAILERGLEALELRELVPEIDWGLLDPDEGARAALLKLADGLERRQLPLPGLAARVRDRAAAYPQPARPTPRRPADRPRKLMITAFGWNDSGGGTTVPRLAAKELARRGWEVTVFHAAVRGTGSRLPYEITEWEEDHVRLIGVHNRPHGLFDLGNPLRELDDPPITSAFAQALDRLRPDVVHFHNLHNLGAALIDVASVRGLASFFTTHNYWLICPRAYLLHGDGSMCAGPGDGGRCATCVGTTDVIGHRRRLESIRARAQSGLTRILAVSDAVRHTLVSVGYDPEMIGVVRQALPTEREIWQRLGRERAPGRRQPRKLTVAFVGSAYPHKGPQLLVQAAQMAQHHLDVRIIGEVRDDFAAALRAIDQRGVLELEGGFAPSELSGLLADVDVAVLPSMWWDCAPLVAAECLAARVPLVVPRLGGLPEAIRDEHDGLLFEPLDAGHLARQLDRLAGEPDLLERLQTNISEPRSFDSYVDELEACYDDPRSAPVAPDGESEPEIRWKGDFGLPTSLSIINDQVVKRLPLRIQRLNRIGRPEDPPLSHGSSVEVHHEWPPDFTVPESGRFATIVPWEFGAPPQRWLPDIAGRVDELWVPSDYVRNMYVEAGIEARRVHVIPNGVDLEAFHPRPVGAHAPAQPRRFLYVGGITRRKGVDLLLAAWDDALAGRDDVVLVVKAANAAGVYGGPNEVLRDRAAADRLPRVELVEDDLDTDALAELYRSCDVLVHPYRGEGFAMPVLEAMASGLPVIVTAGGPTDEFCPAGAGWRIRSERLDLPPEDLDDYVPHGQAWMLEPDPSHLAELLRAAAAADASELAQRGAAGREAAEQLSWDAVAQRYLERITALAAQPWRQSDLSSDTFPLEGDVGRRILATPAWRGEDQLDRLLAVWSQTTPQSDTCLYLLADPATAGSSDQIEAHVMAAAERAGVNVESCADIEILLEPFRSDRDALLHRAMDLYVPIHPGCEGHARLARRAGKPVLGVDSEELAGVLASGTSA